MFNNMCLVYDVYPLVGNTNSHRRTVFCAGCTLYYNRYSSYSTECLGSPQVAIKHIYYYYYYCYIEILERDRPIVHIHRADSAMVVVVKKERRDHYIYYYNILLCVHTIYMYILYMRNLLCSV